MIGAYKLTAVCGDVVCSATSPHACSHCCLHTGACCTVMLNFAVQLANFDIVGADQDCAVLPVGSTVPCVYKYCNDVPVGSTVPCIFTVCALR
jgi:hypothetical protein